MNDRPRAYLIGVSPYPKERTDILRQPNEKPDQHERQEERYVPIPVQWPKYNSCPRVQPQRAGRDIPSIVADEVVGKEVRVDHKGIESSHPIGRMMANSHIQQSPRLDDVTTHRRIHEPRKERNPQDLRISEVRVRPSSNPP